MKTLAAALALAACAAPVLAQQTQTPAPPAQPIRVSKIILVGDSTMQVNSGWGGAFCAHHVTSFLTCVDLGRGGRSTSSYRAEGSWEIARAEMSVKGYEQVYVLIQLGHNDQPGKPGRSTDLKTEFPANMTRYVTEARAAGAIPVLVTPLTRRQFKDGKLDRDLDDWAAAVRKVAADTKAPLLDLNKDSADAVQALGPALSARFAQALPSPQVAEAFASGTTIESNTGVAPAPAASERPAGAPAALGAIRPAFDYTHLGVEGAEFFASMVTRELIDAVPALRSKLIP